MLVGLFMNFLHLDVIKMLIYSAVLNALISPFILTMIVLISSNEKIMKEWKNSSLTKFIGWTITFVMALASILTIWYIISG